MSAKIICRVKKKVYIWYYILYIYIYVYFTLLSRGFLLFARPQKSQTEEGLPGILALLSRPHKMKSLQLNCLNKCSSFLEFKT